jgi:PleD family two-component response regulator
MENKKNKILIVDDDDDIRSLYSEVFKKEGFEVEEAVDGLEGLDKATKNVPDVIFSGIIMPRMDGFGLKEALNKNVSTANVPMVMSSHMGRKEDEVRAKEMGVKDFIVQGMVTPRQASERIKAILGSKDYLLKFYPQELVAQKLASDFNLKENFKCSNCDSEMVLKLGVPLKGQQEFFAKFVCPKCGK